MENKVLQSVVDDGTREVQLVNKFGKLICTIHIRPSDVSIVDRYDELVSNLENILQPLVGIKLKNDGTAAFEEGWATLKKVEDELKKRINFLFDMDDADAIFATRAPFSSVGGEFFCVRVINALGSVIETAITKEYAASEQRMSKYLKKQESTDAGAAADHA